MLFSSLTFLLFFLPITLGMYFVWSNRTYRNIVILIASLFFYGWGEPKLILLMLTLLFINYVLAILMDKYNDRKRTFWLIATATINLSILFYFKYFNFVLNNVNRIFNTKFISNVTLPIGISFYLFQVLSYAIDVYRKEVPVQKSFFLLSTYIALFPQLIAGPIVRYSTVEEQLKERHESWDKFYHGLRRFIVGMIKKVLLSNNAAILANLVFVDTSLNDLNFTLAWIGAIGYTLQIYFDFSGYSDMAIGLGKMFGFDFLENFNYPYVAISITDFWRRWHISLSTWFRDYVYIPLGGNRRGLKRQLFNIFVVWSLTGLWHGAAWNFVLWGIYFACILVLEKTCILKLLSKMPKIVQHLYSLLLIIIGWVIFNGGSMAQIGALLKNMFFNFSLIDFSYIKNLRIMYLWPYIAIAIVACTPFFKKLDQKLIRTKTGEWISNAILIFLFYWVIVLLVNDSYNPFIYFRF